MTRAVLVLIGQAIVAGFVVWFLLSMFLMAGAQIIDGWMLR